jgi:hypothetical protein
MHAWLAGCISRRVPITSLLLNDAVYTIVLGSYQEIRYELMTFGILMDMFPLTADGKFALENHRDWIAQRLKLESMDSPMFDERVIVPGPTDVLMGRDWAAQLHPGNIRFRNIIAELLEAYENARKREKTRIAQGVVRDIKASGCHFLKLNVAGYVVVDDSTARAKVSSAFRDRRKTLHAEATRNALEAKADGTRVAWRPPDDDKGEDDVWRV